MRILYYFLLLSVLYVTPSLGQHSPTRRYFHQKHAPSTDPYNRQSSRRDNVLQPTPQSLNEGRHVMVEVIEMREGSRAHVGDPWSCGYSHYTQPFKVAEKANKRDAILKNISSPVRITMSIQDFSQHALTNSAMLYSTNAYGALKLAVQLYPDSTQGVVYTRKGSYAPLSTVLQHYAAGSPVLGINEGRLKYTCGFCEGRKIVPNGYRVEAYGRRELVFTECTHCHGVGYRFTSVNVLYSIVCAPPELASE